MLLYYATCLALIFVITYRFCCHFTYDITGDTTRYCCKCSKFWQKWQNSKSDIVAKVRTLPTL